MLSYYLGVPGSGKTDLAVDFLLKNYKKYDYIYLNVADFQLDFFKVKYKYKEIYTLNLEIIYNHMKVIMKLETEDEKVEYSKKHKIFNTLIIVDEAHNFFSKEDPVWIFFLSYHRHFSMDLIFITQNIDLIHQKYKMLSESFVVGQRRSLAVFDSKLTYFVYSTFYFSKNNLLKKFTVKKEKLNHICNHHSLNSKS